MRHDDLCPGTSRTTIFGRDGKLGGAPLGGMRFLRPAPSGPQAPAPAAAATAAPVATAAPAEAAVAPPVALAPTPDVVTRDRFPLAVRLLEQGNPDQARVELNAYLAEVPNSPAARNLLAQIDTPIAMLFPAENFTVQLAQAKRSATSLALLGDVTASMLSRATTAS